MTSTGRYNDNAHDCRDDWAWAVVCGVLSLVLVIIIIALMKFKPEVLDGTVGYIIYLTLFGLWVVGIAVCTFEKPFAPGPPTGGNFGVAGNGYFAIWACAIFSGVLVYVGVPPVTDLLAKVFGALDDGKRILVGVSLYMCVNTHLDLVILDLVNCACG